MPPGGLPKGIVPVLQTPFDREGHIDFEDLQRLVEEAIRSGASGLLAPAVASEVGYLSTEERRQLIRFVADAIRQRVPFVVGASSDEVEESAEFARVATLVGAAGYLVAVPDAFYRTPEEIPGFFKAIASQSPLPLLIQDLQWSGPGLSLSDLRALKQTIPTLVGVKIETVPSGPKYTQVRAEFGDAFYICGGWAVPQIIEALDRGVDAMIPEASMVSAYAAIYRTYVSGRRQQALEIFLELLPVIAFSNQEIRLSIAFFKLLLVRKGIFRSDKMRWPGFQWDAYNRRIAEELIDLYLALEERIGQGSAEAPRRRARGPASRGEGRRCH